MKHGMIAMLGSAVVLCALACVLQAGEQAPLKDIALANAGAVDARMLERLQTFAHSELGIAIRAVNIPKVQIKALHEAGAACKKHMETNDYGMVVLVAPDIEIQKHVALLPDIKAAVVNVTALAAKDDEVYARRLERQIMRSIGFLLGLPQSPEPRDVSRPYASLADLDSMGRNFSAPSKVSLEKAAEAAGLLLPPPAPPEQRE